MKLMRFFVSGSSKKGSAEVRKWISGKSCGSFGSSAASSSDAGSVAATPRTVLPSASGAKKAPSVAVTREQLEAALRRVVASEEELVEMLAEAGAGLALEEIAAADEGELRETFAVFDADGDGRISAEELRAVLAWLGDERCSVEDCRRMIGGVDADGDGFVCFDEFARMMMHGP